MGHLIFSSKENSRKRDFAMIFVFDQLVYSSSYQDGLVTSFCDGLKMIDSVNTTKQSKLYFPDKCTCSFAGNNDKKLLRY